MAGVISILFSSAFMIIYSLSWIKKWKGIITQLLRNWFRKAFHGGDMKIIITSAWVKWCTVKMIRNHRYPISIYTHRVVDLSKN